MQASEGHRNHAPQVHSEELSIASFVLFEEKIVCLLDRSSASYKVTAFFDQNEQPLGSNCRNIFS